MLTDETFLASFENLSLDPCQFDHYGHLRITWLYLNTYSSRQAVDLILSGIAKYAEHLGATDKFHYTITEAIVRIIAYRMTMSSASSLTGFLSENKDLVNNMLGVVRRHYSEQVLQSNEAKSAFIAPDISALPC